MKWIVVLDNEKETEREVDATDIDYDDEWVTFNKGDDNIFVIPVRNILYIAKKEG